MTIFGGFKICSMALGVIAILSCLTVTWAQDYASMFNNNPSQSSSYARVQYANNKANITRRIGMRDPTIQYVSFDELYNKYNSNNNNRAPPPEAAVVLGSSSKSTVSSGHDVNIDNNRWDGTNHQEAPQPEEVTTTTTTTTTAGSVSSPAAVQPPHQFNPAELGNDMLMSETSHDNMPINFLSNNKMDTGVDGVIWDDERPDLTNGWTVERPGDEMLAEKTPQKTSPKTITTTTTTTTEVTPGATRSKPVSGLTSQGLDQVYAYSNAYNQNFNKKLAENDTKSEIAEMSTQVQDVPSDATEIPTATFTKTTEVTPSVVTTSKRADSSISFQNSADGTAEYAHAFGGDSNYGHTGAGAQDTTLTLPVQVVEASWPKPQQAGGMSDISRRRPTPQPADDRIDVAVIEEQPSNHPPSQFLTPSGEAPPPSRRQPQKGPIAGAQSAWRPFNGPTIPPSTMPPPPSTPISSAKMDVIVKTTGQSLEDSNSTTDETGPDTLFYGEAAKMAAMNNERFRQEQKRQQQMFNNNQGPPQFNQQRPMMPPPRFMNDRPPMMMNNGPFPNQRPPPPGMNGPPQRPPMFNQRPLPSPQDQQMSQQVGSQQMLVIPNIAENEINVAASSSPSPAGGQPPKGPDGQRFPGERPPLNNNRPPFQFPPPQQQRPFMNEQRFPFRQPPPQQQQQQQWAGDRPPWPGADHMSPPHNNDNKQEFPLPTPIMPSGGPPRDIPTGPVGLPPQLLPNVQGRPSMLSLPAGQNGQDRINIPVPRPGILGSSPQNPLPGPPIALPGVPAGPFVIADQQSNQENGPNGNRPPHRNGPQNNNNPQFNNNNFQPDRVDGNDDRQQQGDNGNFAQPQQQGPFGHRNPNFPPQFRPNNNNFQRPPPPQQQSSGSATSLLKSLFSKFFPFARSLGDEGAPIVDYDAFMNGTAALSVDPALYDTLARSAANSSEPLVINIQQDGFDLENDANATESAYSEDDLIHTSTTLTTDETTDATTDDTNSTLAYSSTDFANLTSTDSSTSS